MTPTARTPCVVHASVLVAGLVMAPARHANAQSGLVTSPAADDGNTAISPPTDAARAQARTHFLEGVAAFDRGAYAEALRAFQRAYAIAPHPSVRLDIANCYLELHRGADALTLFEAYLAETAGTSTPQRRAVTRRVRELRPRYATLRVSAGLGSGAPAQLAVWVDGRAIETFDGISHAESGTHTVTIRAAQFPSMRQRIDLEAGVERDLTMPMVGGSSGGTGWRGNSYEFFRVGAVGFSLAYAVAITVGFAGASGAFGGGNCALAWNLVPVAGPVLGSAWGAGCTRGAEAGWWLYAITDAGIQIAGLAFAAAGWLSRRSGTRRAGSDWFVIPGAGATPIGISVGVIAF